MNFESKGFYNVADLLFVEKTNGVFRLFTRDLIGNGEITLDSWDGMEKNFSIGNNLYPDKLSQQNGKDLKMTTFTYKPYSVPSM